MLAAEPRPGQLKIPARAPFRVSYSGNEYVEYTARAASLGTRLDEDATTMKCGDEDEDGGTGLPAFEITDVSPKWAIAVRIGTGESLIVARNGADMPDRVRTRLD